MSFTEDWFSQHIPQWEKDLAEFKEKSGLCFLEIGSYEGRSAMYLLNSFSFWERGGHLVCIDTWEAPEVEERFDLNTVAARAWLRLKKYKGPSNEWLRSSALDRMAPFDFIYIDGSHKASDVLEDAVLSWQLLKRGGIMTFDDYVWYGGENDTDRPKLAIDAFLQVYEGQYELLHKRVQVTVRKR